MKGRRYIAELLLVLVLGIFFRTEAAGQIYRIGAGLSLATGLENGFNTSTIGNPGLKIKTWYALNRKGSIHIVPTITAFNRSYAESSYFYIKNYGFMADLDGQYMIFHEGTAKVIVFAGVNYSYFISEVGENDPKYPLDIYAPNAPGNVTDYALGGNVGAGLELRMGDHWDMNLQGKYILSKYSQFIISIEGVYYFSSRRKVRRR